LCDKKTIKEIYFTCQTGSRKTDEMVKNSKSSVYFTSDLVTVWLYGDASVTRDEGVRKKIWNDNMLRIYTEGVDSPRLTIIRFVPKKIRIGEGMGGYGEFDL
jgi:general stress protein 26